MGFWLFRNSGIIRDCQRDFEHLEETVDINLYDDKNCAYYLPAYYQNMTELGYYGFDTVGLSTYLKLEKIHPTSYFVQRISRSFTILHT